MDTMGLIEDLQKRSGNQCELCGASGDLKVYEVPPVSTGGADGSLLGCATCIGQLEEPDTADPNHWRCLNESMWSEQDAVKVVAWRMLNRLRSEERRVGKDGRPWRGPYHQSNRAADSRSQGTLRPAPPGGIPHEAREPHRLPP